MGFILTVITNNKKHVKWKENEKFHSFNRVLLQQAPTFQKIRKTTTLHRKQKQNKSYLGWPTPQKAEWERSQDL